MTEAGQLAMHGDRYVELGRHLESGPQGRFVGGREVVPSARTGEGLEADDAGIDHLGQVADRRRDQATPHGDVDATVTSRCGRFGLNE